MENQLLEFIKYSELSASKGTLQSIIFSSPTIGEVSKIRIELRRIGDKVALQAEFRLTEGRVKQQNIELHGLNDFISKVYCDFKRAELYDTGGSISLLKSKKGKFSLVRHGAIGKGESAEIKDNNKEKKYILTGKEEFLRHLGISDANGRIYDKKQSKFRQINRFLENLRDVMKYLPSEGELYIEDLCCGKSYLSFAVYHYLTFCLSRKVTMVCVDLKQSVMDYCAEISRLCSFNGMSFICSDISSFNPPNPPHLVISLHACDTATDMVLDKGISHGALVILSTPCCHRDLSHRLKCPELDFIYRHSILKSKFCDAATDALRILRLEATGYSCAAIELIDPDDTPKNVLIRAIKKKDIDYKSAAATLAADKYKKAYLYLTGEEAPELPVK